MLKIQVLSIFLISLLLFSSFMISADPTLNDLKFKYLYTNYNYGDAEFGEIRNNQDLAIKMSYSNKIVVTIFNNSDENFHLYENEPVRNIDNDIYLTISNLDGRIIPARGSITFQINVNYLPAVIKRTKIVIMSDEENDEDFEFGLWLNAASGSGGS